MWQNPRTLGGDACGGTQGLHPFVPGAANGGGCVPRKCPCSPWGDLCNPPYAACWRMSMFERQMPASRRHHSPLRSAPRLRSLSGSALRSSSWFSGSVCHPSPAWTALLFSCHKHVASPGKQRVTPERCSARVGEGHAAAKPLQRAQAARGPARSTENIDFSGCVVLRSVALQRRKLLRRSQQAWKPPCRFADVVPGLCGV